MADLIPESIMLTVFFFFQAEDGIRDLYVTGVQTCALPISWSLASSDDTWVSTVWTDRYSLAAMSALDRPSPRRRSTSASRAVTPLLASSAGTAGAAFLRRGTGPPASRSSRRARSR